MADLPQNQQPTPTLTSDAPTSGQPESTSLIITPSRKPKTTKIVLALLSFFLIFASIPAAVYLVKQRQEIRKRAAYCAICDKDIGECERDKGRLTGFSCQYAPPECPEKGKTWQPDENCEAEPTVAPSPPVGEECTVSWHPQGKDYDGVHVGGACLAAHAQNCNERPGSFTRYHCPSGWGGGEGGGCGQNQAGPINFTVDSNDYWKTVCIDDFGGLPSNCPPGQIDGSIIKPDGAHSYGYSIFSIPDELCAPTSTPTPTPTPTKTPPELKPSPTPTPTPTKTPPELKPSPTPTPTPTSTPPSYDTQCEDCKAYDENWNEIIDLSTISIGQTVHFVTWGFTTHPEGITKARFRINDGTWQETTSKYGDKFYISYTIPSAGSYTVESEIYNPALGWY